jgi:hypothetical protein
MSFEVYQLRVYPCEDNRYAVGRQETWQLARSRTFDNKEDATEYIFNSTIIHVPEFTNLALGLTGDQRLAFAQAFCFDDERYLKYRRFFLGKPDFRALRSSLEQEGVKVLS